MTKRKRIKKLSTDPSAFPDKPIKFKPFRRYKVKHSEWEYQLDEPWYRRDSVGEIQLYQTSDMGGYFTGFIYLKSRNKERLSISA